MKKLCLLLCLLMLLTACRSPWAQEPDYVQPVSFYYLSAAEGQVQGANSALYSEIHDLGAGVFTAKEVLERYLQGPESKQAALPFPAALKVQSAEIQDGLLTIEFSQDLQLNGMQQKLAEACLVLTMTQLPEIRAVQIGRHAPMQAGAFLLYDDSATSDQVTVKLYFSDANGRYLVEETRSRSFGTPEEIPTYILQQLLDGPHTQDSLPVLPEGTNLLGVELEGGVCTVNLSEAFWLNRPTTHGEARMTIFSVVNALTELSQIDSVQFRCVGVPLGDYRGIDLSRPLYREEPALGKDAPTSLDRVIYLPCGTEGKLAAVPMQIHQTAGRVGTDAVLNALLTFKPANGYENPFPDGTQVMDQETVGGTCTVTFNSAFGLCDEDPVQAQKAVRAVVATLCALDGIDRVQVQVNNTTLTQVDISRPMKTGTAWIVP